MATDTILLCCATCGRSINYPRHVDRTIPKEIVKIVQGKCDQCWDGDFDGEDWFDAEGRHWMPLPEPPALSATDVRRKGNDR